MSEETITNVPANTGGESAVTKVRTKDGYTKGVLKTAKEMVTAKKTYQEVFAALINIYTAKGRTPAQAKHNAQSTAFNAMKSLGIKKADGEPKNENK